MKVIQLITTCNPDTVVAEYNRIFPDYPVTLESYRKDFLDVISKKVLETTSHIVQLSHYQVKHDDPSDDIDRMDLSILLDGIPHSMSFQSWSIILNCEFKCAIDYPQEFQVAHLYWEMTIHGSEEDSLEIKDIIHDRIEEIDRTLEHSNNGDNKRYGFAIMTNSKGKQSCIFDALFPDASDEEKAQMEVDALKKVENYKTRRVYRDGIPQKEC